MSRRDEAPTVITPEYIERFDACPTYSQQFRETWPKGMPLTVENVKSWAEVRRKVDGSYSGFADDVLWLADECLVEPQPILDAENDAFQAHGYSDRRYVAAVAEALVGQVRSETLLATPRWGTAVDDVDGEPEGGP